MQFLARGNVETSERFWLRQK